MIINLVNEQDNKYEKILVMKEIENIYKTIFSDLEEYEISIHSKRKSFTTPPMQSETIQEVEELRKENKDLKIKLNNVDKEFEKIHIENGELREYIKIKSDNLDEMKTVLNNLVSEINEMKKKEEFVINTVESLERDAVINQDVTKKPDNVPKLKLNVRY